MINGLFGVNKEDWNITKKYAQYDPSYILNNISTMTQNSKIVIHRLINVKNYILNMKKGVLKCV